MHPWRHLIQGWQAVSAEPLVWVDASAFGDISISERSRQFLMKIGLPREVSFGLTFSILQHGVFPLEVETIPGEQDTSLYRFVMIGYGLGESWIPFQGIPAPTLCVCLDIREDTLWVVQPAIGIEMFLNSDLPRFLECLVRYFLFPWDLVESFSAEEGLAAFRKLKQDLIGIDNSIGDDSIDSEAIPYWIELIFEYEIRFEALQQ